MVVRSAEVAKTAGTDSGKVEQCLCPGCISPITGKTPKSSIDSLANRLR